MKRTLLVVPVLVLGLCVLGCGSAADGAEQTASDGPETTAADAAARAEPGPSAVPEARPQQRPVDVNDLGYDRGGEDAPVLVLEFSDFGCPYCARFAKANLPLIQEEFIDEGLVRWKYVPFVMGMFPNGAEAARAAECAAEQGEDRFWPMHDVIYTHQADWKGTSRPRDLFVGYASDLGLDEDAFGDCYDVSEAVRQRIGINNALAARLSVRATPTFFVNGVRVQGALPMDHFRLLLRGAAAQ